LRLDLGRRARDGQSYKRAWDLVDEINPDLPAGRGGTQTGGKNGGGAVLTPFGLSLVARYRKIEPTRQRGEKGTRGLSSDIGRPGKAASR